MYAIVTGDPVPSFSPWPLSSEKEGAQWCGIIDFIIYSSPVFIQKYNNQISDLIKDIPECDALQVHVSKTVDCIMHINIKLYYIILYWHICNMILTVI